MYIVMSMPRPGFLLARGVVYPPPPGVGPHPYYAFSVAYGFNRNFTRLSLFS